jgi:hypothetical protein
MGAVHAAILSLQEFQQFAQGDIRKLPEEAGEINEIPLTAALPDGDRVLQWPAGVASRTGSPRSARP